MRHPELMDTEDAAESVWSARSGAGGEVPSAVFWAAFRDSSFRVSPLRMLPKNLTARHENLMVDKWVRGFRQTAHVSELMTPTGAMHGRGFPF
jgi:hypothetical protein